MLLQCMSRDSSKIWEGLPERDPKFLSELLSLLFAGKRPPEGWREMFWVEDPGTSRLCVITPGHWKAIKEIEGVNQYLPMPSLDWRITSPNDGSSGGYRRKQVLKAKDGDRKPRGKQS